MSCAGGGLAERQDRTEYAGMKLKVDNISKYFSGSKAPVEALRAISLDVEQTEFVSIVGRSGCGKTTLLRIIAGLESASSGRILLDKGGRLVEVSEPGQDRGMVFQELFLFPWRTALENIEFGLESQDIARSQRRDVARSFLRLVNLADFGDLYPSQLSGGMRQRIAIARALATNPEILLMDEPFGALDFQTRNSLHDELLRIWQVTSKTILLVTHNVEEAVYLSDRIIVLKPHPGEVCEVMKLDLPRPRVRSSADFLTIVEELVNFIGQPATIDD